MARKTVNPKELFNSTQYGFSQITMAAPGTHVFISGQVAWDEDGRIVGENNLELQTQKAIDNLEIAIRSVGGSLDNIMMLRIYKVEMKTGDEGVISRILKKTFGSSNPPASTWINVKGLASKHFLIEIEAQAII